MAARSHGRVKGVKVVWRDLAEFPRFFANAREGVKGQ